MTHLSLDFLRWKVVLLRSFTQKVCNFQFQVLNWFLSQLPAVTCKMMMGLYGMFLMRSWIENLIWTGSGRGDTINFTLLDIVMASYLEKKLLHKRDSILVLSNRCLQDTTGVLLEVLQVHLPAFQMH
uniref:Uncharacterized protein n=1 Tax=Salix viminalis TaxID=40686 RepID=A0A6N2M6T7_SALVM